MTMLKMRRHHHALRLCALSALALPVAMGAHAPSWSVTNLHPAGATSSAALDVGDGQQVGSATVGGANHACKWGGSAASWVDLNPAGAERSTAYSAAGSQQAGTATIGGAFRAIVWTGAPASAVDLTPYGAGATESVGFGMGGGQQVGYVLFGDPSAPPDPSTNPAHAALWDGAAASWVDLNPPGTSSYAIGTDGTEQVGAAWFTFGIPHAVMWSGSADTCVDLHPDLPEAVYSWGNAIDDGEQVGYVMLDTPDGWRKRASLWRGSRESWVNLSPAGSENTDSIANAVHEGEQVGSIGAGVNSRACHWSGDAASCVDLHRSLPRWFQSSSANGIWHDAGYTYVVGSGYNTRTDRDEALMWRKRR